jgi:hypothetical protein
VAEEEVDEEDNEENDEEEEEDVEEDVEEGVEETTTAPAERSGAPVSSGSGAATSTRNLSVWKLSSSDKGRSLAVSGCLAMTFLEYRSWRTKPLPLTMM